jgi:hypothetical protein
MEMEKETHSTPHSATIRAELTSSTVGNAIAHARICHDDEQLLRLADAYLDECDDIEYDQEFNALFDDIF